MGVVGMRGHIEEHPFPAAHQSRALPDIGEAIDQGKLLVLSSLLFEGRIVPIIGRRPIERLQVSEALGPCERAGNVFAHRAPGRGLIDIALAPEVLEDAFANGALGWTLGVEMAHVDAELPEQSLSIGIAHMGQKAVPRGLFRPEIAGHPVRLLVAQGH